MNDDDDAKRTERLALYPDTTPAEFELLGIPAEPEPDRDVEVESLRCEVVGLEALLESERADHLETFSALRRELLEARSAPVDAETVATLREALWGIAHLVFADDASTLELGRAALVALKATEGGR